ncbi:putative RNA methyltransferase [Aquisalibacillus elongatus]|uniref:23S rRNA m(1)G-748 methyltransferase n=1 Tax=Aquisalibacillus elongatus TaxID=485577 RepID=A0A3N5B6V7_9BACI|nr:methyltransferase domain-containing protein [Aquisalibacillus elongatus]RPF53426.1 23S rRNA m(1)G-748 methyltransferase [Aquisalibacillus elongatus]
MKKIDQFKAYMKKHEWLFQCPICQEAMSVEENRYVCGNNHSFDIAKKGYVNFMMQPVKTKYDKTLFEARHHIIESGMYSPVHKEIAELVEGSHHLVDLGCGEGSHLAHIRQRVPNPLTGVGLDISKEGVMTAAKNHLDTVWCVGDLAQTPFKGSAFDTALNFLSPARYDEFKRILSPEGRLIKVIPNSGYLKELREAVYGDEPYDNQDTVELFESNMKLVDRKRVTYQMPLNQDLVTSLVKMTPLTWNVEEDLDVELNEITVDLDILVGVRE